MSLNVNHPIGIHVTNARGFLASSLSQFLFYVELAFVVGKEEIVCYNFVLYRINID